MKNTVKSIIDKAKLKGQTEVDLSNCNLNEIPKDLFNLNKLKRLNLSNEYDDFDISTANNIKTIPDGISKLYNLEELRLSHTGLVGFPESILKLKKLKKLEICNQWANITIINKIDSIPPEIKRLENLELLNLGSLKLEKLPNELGSLVKLKNLELYANKISSLPESFINLKNLTHLNLLNNSLAIFPEIICELMNLEHISLHDNYLLEIPTSILKLKKLKTLYLSSGNPNLKSPPREIIEKGTKAIISYLNEITKQGEEYIYEAKVLILGQPRAGKTTLRIKLSDRNAKLPGEEDTTRGIDINKLNFKLVDKDGLERRFDYNVWDFGGQQIYQTTHQFFLTRRSLYILVVDSGRDNLGNDDSTINYWLQAIEILGDRSPLLFVVNEKNKRKVNIDIAQKQSRFPFLKSNYNLNLNGLIPNSPTFNNVDSNEFTKLVEDIELELKRLPLAGYPMPKSWVSIREELQTLVNKNPYISREQYIVLCNKHGISDFDKQMELSSIFHDLGIFLHFQDNSTLEEIIILQNVWATDAVFAVLDNEKVKVNKGRFTNIDLNNIWKKKGYERKVHKKLLSLMLKFELCYSLTSEHKIFIIPQLLNDSPPANYTWQPKNDLPLQYRYDFMPQGILTRFIVRLQRSIEEVNNQQQVWKTGVKINGYTLDCPNTYAEVTEYWDNKQLSILVQGKYSKKLMTILTYELDSLNNEYFKKVKEQVSFEDSLYYKMIPCNCNRCSQTTEKHFFDYNEIIERKDFGKKTIECRKKPFETVLISSLIDGVFDIKKNNNAARIFISYSHKDEYWKDELIKNLSSLRNQDLISDWNDRQIQAGFWDSQIEESMENADIFLLLITHNFLASSYITSKEITKAYSNFKLGKSKIFPIICDSCDWQLQPITKSEKEFHPITKKELFVWLGKFQAFPKDGKPIKNWINQQDGFLNVINELKNYI